MKTPRLLLLAALLGGANFFALAQEAAPSPAPAVEPEVTLIPEPLTEKKKAPVEAVKTDKGEKPDGAKASKTSENAEELLDRIHYREAHTKAERDPKVQAEWARALHARTDYEKREALKNYYTLLHARIIAVDPAVKKTSDLRRTTSLHRLEQTRIDPTEPLDPQERADRFSGANE